MKAYQRLEKIGRQLVSAKEAANMDDAIVQAVAANPDLYQESLSEGTGTTLSEEVSAALSNLSEEDRATIERKAMEIYLGGSGASENDAYVQAMMKVPDLERKLVEASSKIHRGHDGNAPSAASLPELVSPDRRAGSSFLVSAKSDDDSDKSEKIREDTRKKLATLAELGSDSPWDQLVEISLRTVEQYPDMDEKEAFRHACLDNPELFERWQDSQLNPSAVPRTV